MKKQILNLGKLLTRSEQKLVFGGFFNLGLVAKCTAECDGREDAVCDGGVTCTATDNAACTEMNDNLETTYKWCSDQPVLVNGLHDTTIN